MTTEEGAADPGTPADAIGALATISEHGEQIRQRELTTALRKLDGLDDKQQAAIERLAERLVEQVLESPIQSLLTAAAEADDETVVTALSLFDDVPDDRETDCSTPGDSITEFASAQD